MAQLEQWHNDYMRDCIEPIMLPKALELLGSTATPVTSW
jgi:hypothetical protein